MCSTYLTFFMRDELLDEMPLYPYPDPPPQGTNGDPSGEIFMAPSVSYSYDQARTKKDNTQIGGRSRLYAAAAHSLSFAFCLHQEVLTCSRATLVEMPSACRRGQAISSSPNPSNRPIQTTD